jgi:hypothetical protein
LPLTGAAAFAHLRVFYPQLPLLLRPTRRNLTTFFFFLTFSSSSSGHHIYLFFPLFFPFIERKRRLK